MRNFKELKIWQKGFQIAVNTFHITETFPSKENFGLALQIRRAGVSIPSNIAEGSSRSGAKDYSRFAEISLGSAFELETQLLIAKEVKYGNILLIEKTLAMLTDEEKMLASFINTLSIKR